jgi:N-acylneuraminate cytidylyltransferase
MRKIAIIPARGGSKRIPRKNIKPFFGKPIIAYSIKAALQSNLFDEVMVSTDDKEIAEVSKNLGASVPFLRSAQASNDFATTADVLIEVLEAYRKEGKEFVLGCFIYPTAPLITAKRLQESLDLLITKNFDAVLPVLKFSYPIWRSLRVEQGKALMNWPEHVNSRSQDLPPAYHDAGQFGWFNTEAFLRNKIVFTQNTGALELTELEVQDIDNDTDWKLAELKFQLLQHRVKNE